MSDNTDSMNAGPNPIQLPSQDPAIAPASQGASSTRGTSSRRTLQAALAGGAAVALLAVAGVSGFAIGSASDNHGQDDGPGMSGVEANVAPDQKEGMRGGPEGMRDGDRDGRQGRGDGNGRGHRNGPGQNMPRQDGPSPDGGPSTLPSLPATPSS